jgi:2-keto-myo-inositol isomerase
MKASLIEDAEASKKAGFDYLELRDNKLEDLLRSKNLSEIRKVFQDLGIQPLAMNSLERANLQDQIGFQKIVERAEVLCQYSSALGCPILIVVPRLLDELSIQPDKGAVKEDACHVLEKLEAIACPYGVKIAFEFLGFVTASVNALSFAHEIVTELHNKHIGLVIDTFHFFLSGEPLSVLDRIDPEEIFLIHIADAEDLPKPQLWDKHRIIPGEGTIPLRDFVRKVQAIGYQGTYSIELFNPTYWEWKPEEVTTLCYQRMRALFE